MPDVFDRIIGNDRAVAAMRQHATRPVHAYLFTGPPGAGLHEAAVCFAAALQCPRHGCGACEACRLVVSDADPDVTFLERAGLSWRVDELRDAERIGRRRPLGARQIVVIENVELATTGAAPSAPALLKSLEEAPARTVFLLTAEDVPDALDTVASRCVRVAFQALGEEDIERVIVREGASPEKARVAAEASLGDLRRARVLVRDAALGDRIAQWRAVPTRLSGTPASATAVVSEIAAALDQAITPLVRVQDEEMAQRVTDAKALGQRSVANRREVEAQFKREQRRFRVEEVRVGLSTLSDVYRDRIANSVVDLADGVVRDPYRVGSALRAVDAIAEAARRLAQNMDETLLLTDLMLTLLAP